MNLREEERQVTTYNLCKICQKRLVEQKVYVNYKGRVRSVFDSALKAMNYALEHHYVPCTISFIYRCKGCGNEEVKGQRVFKF